MSVQSNTKRDGGLRPTRRALLKGAAAAAGVAGVIGPLSAKPKTQPNIVFILADDMGYADLSCYGRRDYQTPVLDKLAVQGLRATHAYANSPVCSPTRAALLSGRYQYRLAAGLPEPIGGPVPVGFPPDHPTLPSLLRSAGYRTSLVGKWHLGAPPQFSPLKSGYDHFFGIVDGGADYFTHGFVRFGMQVGHGLLEDDVPVERIGYMTDLLGDRAVGEIEAAKTEKRPFFLSLHFTAPHWPWEGPEDEKIARALKDSYHADGGSLKIYAEMVQSLDANVAKVLKTLEDQGLAEDTIVIFTSDNGGERFSDTWPLIGGKGELLEGGIRVPMLIRWPSQIKAGGVTDQVVISMDWLPTLLAAAGTAPDPKFPSDGMNLLDVLSGARAPRQRKLFWRYKASGQAAVLDGSWKYLKIGEMEGLFNLAEDERERANLKDLHRDRFDALKRDHERWNAQMLPYPEGSYSDTPKGRHFDRY